MDVRVGLWRRLRAEELMLLSCVVGEDLESPWTAKRSNQSILKEISPGYLLKVLILKLKLTLWPPDEKGPLTRKDPDAGKDWRQEEKGTTEDEMVGWHHWLNGHAYEQALEAGDGQGSLACCSPWSHKESDMTDWVIEQQQQQSKYLSIGVFKTCAWIASDRN